MRKASKKEHHIAFKTRETMVHKAIRYHSRYNKAIRSSGFVNHSEHAASMKDRFGEQGLFVMTE